MTPFHNIATAPQPWRPWVAARLDRTRYFQSPSNRNAAVFVYLTV